MRFIAWIALFFAFPAWGTWTRVATSQNVNCAASTTCAVTVTSTTAGNLLVALAFESSTAQIQLSAGSAGGSWVFPSNCRAFQSSSTGSTSCGYVLSATGGVTSITMTTSSAPSTTYAIVINEYHSTVGSVAAETVPAGTTSASCSNNCTTASITVTGSADVLIAGIATGNTGCSVGSPWGNFSAPSGDGMGDNISTASGTGATFTQGTSCPTAAAAAAGMIIIGFSEGAGSTGPPLRTLLGVGK